jgi:putative ABC transport system ATP-binding protein
MSAPTLRLQSVTQEYGEGEILRRALDDVSLDVSRGEMVAIMGPSGSGKSTMLTIAGGLQTPTSGAVFIDGKHLGGLGAKQVAQLRRRSMGFIFQDFNLIPTLTAAVRVVPAQREGDIPRASFVVDGHRLAGGCNDGRI